MKAFIIIVVLLLNGCGPSPIDRDWNKKQQQSTDACIAKGGIPIYGSYMDSRMTDCKKL